MDNPVTIGLIMYVIGEVIGFLFGMLYKQRRTAQPYTEAEIQKMEELEQAQLQTAYEIGKQDAQTEQRWIPCSERLPKVPSTNVEIENYLVYSEDGNITVMMWADGWNCTLLNGTVNRKYEIDDVIAWMPLPEPYQSEAERRIDDKR